MTDLVFGGNGFIGTHLVERLLERGRMVRVYDRGPSRFRAIPGKVEYIEGDPGNYGLTREREELGWRPKTGTENGIVQAWEWIKRLPSSRV